MTSTREMSQSSSKKMTFEDYIGSQDISTDARLK